jgi:hypothetical protein
LVVQRSWQFLLTIGIPLISGYFFMRRFKNLSFSQKFFFWLFLFCYFLVAPIKFHLLLIFFVFILLYDSHNFLKTIFAVVLASLLIQPGNFNWYPVPVALALLMHVLENKVQGNFLEYFKKPIYYGLINLFVVGVMYFIFNRFSGNLIGTFSVISSASLLWYRLLPSSSEPLGVIIPIIILSLPLFFIWAYFIRKNRTGFHAIRQLVIYLLLIVFFLGGLLVSVKIGGGNNLHNLDIFFLLMLVVVVYVSTNSIQGDKPLIPINSRSLTIICILNAFLFSLWLLYSTPGPLKIPNQNRALAAVQNLQTEITQIQSKDQKPALFIYQSQLLTSGLIQGTKPVPNYDNVFLMEMAISDNQTVLKEFYSQLEKHSWSAIVMPPLFPIIEDPSAGFVEENNAWVQKIILPMLCSYQSYDLDEDFNYEILIPREANHQCP